MYSRMAHPEEAKLALYAGGDLNWFENWKVGRHAAGCEYCRSQVARFRAAAAGLRAGSGEIPAGLDWKSLAAEMTANINLGLEAGECVASVPTRPDTIGWRAAAVMAGMMIVLLTAWWLNPPQKRQQHTMRAPRIEMRATTSGIELNENGNALTLMHTRGRQKPIFVSAPGTLRARFVDAETGQVTINNVYTE